MVNNKPTKIWKHFVIKKCVYMCVCVCVCGCVCVCVCVMFKKRLCVIFMQVDQNAVYVTMMLQTIE